MTKTRLIYEIYQNVPDGIPEDEDYAGDGETVMTCKNIPSAIKWLNQHGGTDSHYRVEVRLEYSQYGKWQTVESIDLHADEFLDPNQLKEVKQQMATLRR